VSFYPFENPIGFGAADFLALALTLALIVATFLWNRAAFARFAEKTAWCMIALAALPVILRLALLPHHPAPVPDIYDEFGHLLVADTLRHFRLANPPHPMHRFFETFFVLQDPTYSSIYPPGQGMMLALGRAIFGHPWAGVLMSTAALCALVYWMLRAWTSPRWALVGGAIAVITFGPLNSWMNSYWGGSFAAAAGCLVFGSLPRRNWLLLGIGLACVVLIRPYESVYLFAAVLAYLAFFKKSDITPRALALLATPLVAAGALLLLQNHAVTGHWTTLPYVLSQHQYGVPAALTIQADPVPHRDLTPQQMMEYKSQLAFKGGEKETLTSFLLRLEYRVRFYRFFILAPLFVALLFFLPSLRERRFLWVASTLVLFALGINLFPAFQFHYLAPVACLFVLIAVIGLERLARLSPMAAQALIALCVFPFAFWYAMHVFDTRDFSKDARVYETWDGINHQNPERRIAVAHQLAAIPGDILVFVRYSPGHIFQDEWVYNEADIDHARIVWARDLGPEEDSKLRAYYPARQAFLLEPDQRPPSLIPYSEAQ
jgi:hypothetical protein